jgi:hypothetical protein
LTLDMFKYDFEYVYQMKSFLIEEKEYL